MKFFLIILLTVNLWSFDEFINSMRKSGVKISFSTKKNSLKSIPRGMLGQEFIKAKQLDFNGMNLSDNLPTFLGEMRNLMVLNLEGVDISLRELKKIENLKINVLNLNNNPSLFSNGGKLIPIISKFGLTKLYLSNTDGRASDYLSIGTSLPELTVLDLSNNRIDSLENLYLANLSSLRILNLSNNSLSSFSTAHLPKRTLQKLDLSNTSFSNFNFTGDFPSLLSLDLRGNSSVKMDKKYKGAMVLSKATVIPSSLISKNSSSDSLSSTELGENSTSKWITPKNRVCRSNGGEINKHGACKANWKNANKICSASGGRLPTRSELNEVIIDCGGTLTTDVDKDWDSLTDKNVANKSYQSCYKKKGFTPNYYWSATTFASDSSNAWLVNFGNGNDRWGSKTAELYVRCVRGGQ